MNADTVRMPMFLRKLVCKVAGCKLTFAGGANAGCEDDCCSCSIPVYVCVRCDASDYGANQEASEIRHMCALERAEF